ncbi:MAG TPA: hypothetical protein VGO80_00215 [Solirubrobacteraceae bacterium]|jgi:hypothetical protein|nr:hypothetical protein [Solirubrobacteraceae bacterium]
MTLTDTIRRTLSLAAVGAVTAVAALGASASAATIGTPEVLSPGANLPINVPAYRETADNKIKPNYRLVRVRVEVDRGERAMVVMRAPKGFRAITIALGDGHQIGARVEDPDYSGKRSVRVKVYANTTVVKGKTAHGTVYLWTHRA